MKETNKMKFILLTIGILSFTSVFAQVDNEIQSIKERYYRANSADVLLEKLRLENIDFCLEGNNLAIIKLTNNNGKYEFYYDKDNYGNYYTYFAHLESQSNTPDLRAYYNQDNDLLLYKHDQKEIELSGYKRPDEEILLKSINSLNRFLNICSRNLNKKDSKITELENDLEKLKKVQITQVDTIKKELDTEESYYLYYLIRYKDGTGRVIKEKEESVTDHVWEQNIRFYNQSEEFYKLKRSITTFNTSRIIETHEFFYLRQSIKKKTFDNYEIQIKQTKDKEYGYIFDFRRFVPRIEYLCNY